MRYFWVTLGNKDYDLDLIKGDTLWEALENYVFQAEVVSIKEVSRTFAKSLVKSYPTGYGKWSKWK